MTQETSEAKATGFFRQYQPTKQPLTTVSLVHFSHIKHLE